MKYYVFLLYFKVVTAYPRIIVGLVTIFSKKATGYGYIYICSFL